MTVAVLGASPKPDRFANKAIRLLRAHGHNVIPVNPAYQDIDGIPSIPDLDSLAPGAADTITVYMNPDRTNQMGPALVRAKPRRVIFNPGTENPVLEKELAADGIDIVNACTLVMLRTGQF